MSPQRLSETMHLLYHFDYYVIRGHSQKFVKEGKKLVTDNLGYNATISYHEV